MRFGYLRFFAMGVVGIMIPNLDAQDSQDSVFTRKLLIEKTLTEAKTLIEQNDFRKAVNMLERHLGIINGDRTYFEWSDTLQLFPHHLGYRRAAAPDARQQKFLLAQILLYYFIGHALQFEQSGGFVQDLLFHDANLSEL